MKSIKPGRGPSMMGGLVGIFVALFGVAWTIMAVGSGAGFMGIFGLIFVAIAVVNTVYNFKNATGKNRYSEYDITDEGEEPDPFNARFGNKNEDVFERWTPAENMSSKYCPYCGTKVENDFEFCNQCGRKLP